ncbi:MAG: hypothetical protein NZ921_04425 [Candidatus Caldarchaeum sp.]|nr:hypothetical protein [Candidatus Caldarchaeum sp.]
MKVTGVIFIVLLLVISPIVGFSQTDYKVLPIRADLPVNLVFVDVDLTLFGVRSLDELMNRIAANVRKEAKSLLYAFGEPVYAPYVFDIKLQGTQLRGAALTEFRTLWRSLPQPVPRELLELKRITGPISSIHAPTALKTLIDLYKKHIQPNLDGYTIFFICGENALRGKPSYFSYGTIPETGKAGGELQLNMYGGPWWGRAVFVDLCAETAYKEYPRVTALPSPLERINLLSRYVDELIDLQFVKSTVYYPYYNLQVLIDVIVVDATKKKINYRELVESFDVEITEKSLKTLTPYNFYNFRLRLVDADKLPGASDVITLKEIEHRGRKTLTAVFDPYKVYDLLKKAGLLEPSKENYKYIPTIIVVTDYNTLGMLEWQGEVYYLLGIAIESEEDPKYAKAAIAGASYFSLFYEGMSVTVAHEIGHALGLSHPHDDFNEVIQGIVGPIWIYTDSIETYMSYSTTWTEAVKRRTIKDGFYPIRTFWSIFDLDAIDRATISLLLQGYEDNYAKIIETLKNAGLSLENQPTLKNALGVATNWARQSVVEFKRMNYFDRLDFKGLGAQTTNSLEYAFMAWAVTDLLKLYAEGLVRQNERLAPILEGLEKEIDNFTKEVRRLDEQRMTNEAEINRVRERTNEALRTVNELRNRLRNLESEAKQLPELEKKKSELERNISETTRNIDQLKAEASQLRTINMVLMALVVAVVAATGSSLVLMRRKLV